MRLPDPPGPARAAMLSQMLDEARRKRVVDVPADVFDAAAHPDAKLLSLCAEMVAATALTERLRDGDLQVTHTQKVAFRECMERLSATMNGRTKLAAQVTELPATTLDGLRAKAAALRYRFEEGLNHGPKNQATVSIITDALAVIAQPAGREP